MEIQPGRGPQPCGVLAVAAICEEVRLWRRLFVSEPLAIRCPRSPSILLLASPRWDGWLLAHRRTLIWLWPLSIPLKYTPSPPPTTNATAHVFLIFCQTQLFFTRHAR